MRSRSAAAHHALPAAAELRLDPLAALGGRVRPPLGGALRGGAEVLVRPWKLALAGTAEDEQLLENVGEPVDLGHPGVELGDGGACGRHQRARLLEAQAQAGERRAQLVRRVGHEVLLAAQEPGHPAGHLVEGPRERALLGAALDRRARLEVAGRHPARRLVEAAHRARDRARDDQPRDEPDARAPASR